MTCRDAALSMLQRGRVPLPLHYPIGQSCSCGDPNCKGPGKHPAILDWPNVRPTPDEVARWFDAEPNANLGLLCGQASGVVVLDIDIRHGGGDSLNRLQNIPKTRIVRTGGGGWHYYFAYPNGGATVRNRTKIPGYPGLEVKSDGSQVVAPPSLHVSGNRYAFDNSLPLATWPMDLIPGEDKEPLAVPPTVPEGERHTTLASLAGYLRRPGMSPTVILAALRAFNAESCSPPHDDADILRIARDIGAKPPDETAARTLAAHESSPTPSFTIQHTRASVLKHMAIQRPPSLVGDGLLAAGQLALLYGKPGKGKSWLTFQLSIACANGGAFLGLPTSPCKTALFTLECPPWQVQQRLLALSGDDDTGLENISVVCREDLTSALDLALPEHQDAIIAHVRQFGAQLLIVDALSRAHQSDENDAKAMGVILAATDRIRIETGAAVLIVHHERKGPARGEDKDADDLDALRGSTRLQSDPQTALRLVEKSGLFVLRTAKCNWGKSPDPIWLRQDPGGWFLVTDAPEKAKTQAGNNVATVHDFFQAYPDSDFSAAQIHAELKLTKTNGKLVGERTISNYLSDLAKMGHLQASGKNKTARYRYRKNEVISFPIPIEGYDE